VIDGMAMDAASDIRAPDWATLDLYCDRVASAVGRLSVRIFGLAEEPGEALAAAGVTTDDPLQAAADPKLAQACLEVAERARGHFVKAQAIMEAAPRAAVKAPRLMAAAYNSILDRM